MNIPSFLVKAGDVIELTGKDRLLKDVKETIELVKERGIPGWLKADLDKLTAETSRLPVRDDVAFPIEESLIVELYSK